MRSAPTANANDAVLVSPMNGVVVSMNEVKDEAFAACVLGDGVAVEPEEGKLFAPADGVIDNVFDSKHAIGMTTTEGVELLLHVGIDTVKLAGQHFTVGVSAGQKVKQGDLLLTFEMDAIKAAGYLCTTPMIVCNTDDYQSIQPLATGPIKAGQKLLEIKA